jgi:hypothetical protein
MYSPQEIVESLIKKEGIHDGIWGLVIKFGFGASNVNPPDTPSHLLPAAVISIHEIGIQKVDRQNNLTVDASKVNPAKSRRSKKS